jgi:genome maintenance exonuclease 1
MFEHNLLTLPKLTRVDGPDGRYYQTPDGDFKSVTTILSERLDHSAIDAWKKRVGEQEAKKVSQQASTRGTAIHNLAEQYLLNNKDYSKGAMPINVQMFSTIRSILDNNIGTIYGIESLLYSRLLQAAGTADLLAQYNGINSIIDFKTSKRIKTEDQIESYFIQTAAYSLMAAEHSNYNFPQIVILMMVDNEEPLVFIKKARDYFPRVRDIFIPKPRYLDPVISEEEIRLYTPETYLTNL